MRIPPPRPSLLERTRHGHRIQALFWLAGLFFGWRWVRESGPAWQHALDVLLTMLAIMTALRLVQRWRRRRGAPDGALARLPVRDLVVTKLTLVVFALVTEHLLRDWIPPLPARAIAGAGLGVAFATIGPVLHRRHNLRLQEE
jgi:hypothetical protein